MGGSELARGYCIYPALSGSVITLELGPETGGPHGPYRQVRTLIIFKDSQINLYQSERTTLYREHANKLITSGHAYRCFCSSERLASLAEQRSNLGLQRIMIARVLPFPVQNPRIEPHAVKLT